MCRLFRLLRQHRSSRRPFHPMGRRRPFRPYARRRRPTILRRDRLPRRRGHGTRAARKGCCRPKGPETMWQGISAARATVETLERRVMLAANFYVSTTGSDANAGTDPGLAWRHIQKACDAATPGSTVTVLPGRYNEKLVMNVSGNETDGYITFQASGRVVISGKKVSAADVVFINNRNYLKIVGFEIRDNRKVNNG